VNVACLSYWFPKLAATGVPVPETRIVTTDLPLCMLLDGPEQKDVRLEDWQAFVAEVRSAAKEIGGFPCFLRTGHGSGKHDWRTTCYVRDPNALGQHIFNLVEWSEMVDVFGLPTKVWAVRKLLPLLSSFTAFDGFPVNVERRYFIEGARSGAGTPTGRPNPSTGTPKTRTGAES